MITQPLLAPFAYANPSGGHIVSGDIEISGADTGQMTITQSGEKGLIEWQSFSINSNEQVHFIQPSTSSITANKVIGSDPSQILGQLSATGQLLLINPNGVVFGQNAQIDTASFIATTHQMDEARFLGDTGILRFDQVGTGAASIINHGYLQAGDGGTIALLAPQVENHGTIRAHLGQIALVASKGVSLDLYGDGLISFDVSDQLDESLVSGDAVLITQSGQLEADGGHILMTAKAASDLIASSVNISGIQQVQSLSQSEGRISLRADSTVLIEETARFDATSQTASNSKGGEIDIEARTISQGGMLDASGSAEGGTIRLTSAGQTALGGTQLARSDTGTGGEITIRAAKILENEGSLSDVSGGIAGGKISVIANASLTSSGRYQANGPQAGQIDVTAADMRLFSAEFEATGSQDGGLIRLGGSFQGGKTLPATDAQRYAFDGRWPEAGTLENASTLFVNDSTRIDVSAQAGAAGTAVLWSDDVTTFLGAVDASGAQGGAVEISSAGLLRQAVLNQVDVGNGYLLLDPQNIQIGSSAEVQSWSYSSLLAVQNSKGANVSGLARDDEFGRDVAIDSDNNRMAVGASGDDGNSGPNNSGAVYLYRFSDSNFSGATLAGTIGHGYTGANNVNVTLGADDQFGYSLALDGDGDRLAVSAPRDDGSASGSNLGAVYLFTFSDTDFSTGSLAGRIGGGYSGNQSLDLSSSLSNGDQFGYGVALNDAGTRLAVGAPGHSSGGANVSGAVYLFSFSDSAFTSPSQDLLIAKDGADFNIPELSANDIFGASVDFDSDADRLAIGAPWSRGEGSSSETGAVYLMSFADTSYGTPSLAMRIGSQFKTGNDIDQNLTAYDWFGTDVALNSDGTRLAVGVPRDDGLNENDDQAGAVYLFSLNAGFAGGSLTARIGADYQGSKDINMPFEQSHGYRFGESVAFNTSANRLIVGAAEANGFNNDASLTNTGAVYLFRFSDNAFTNGELVGIIGADYQAPSHPTNDDWNSGDEAGTSVALNSDATLLAVGAPADRGMNNAGDSSGAVFLYSFTDTNYGGAVLESIIGKGYTGGDNYDLSSLATDDRFGESVALNGDGDRLAVSAVLSEGNSGPADSGAVYLFSFSDTSFSAPSLSATLGSGYSGGNNLGVSTLGANDLFGASLALSDDANLLAVGAIGDDGDKDDFNDIGAVYLFGFQNGNFSNGSLVGRIGRDYGNTNDIAIASLSDQDRFGRSVAIDGDGNRLAVGAPHDDAGDNKNTDTGAVYLFQFASTDFTSGALYNTLGFSYGAGQDVNVPTLEDGDQFGSSVALDGDGDRLAVGAQFDDGENNANGHTDTGAVYIFSFSDDQFANATLQNIIGSNHSSGNGLALDAIESGDRFGQSIALNDTGDRLAVGTSQMDGWYRNMHSQSGAVVLLGASHLSGGYALATANSYSDLQSADVVINAHEIADQLKRGTDVTLQASNDIKLTTAIQVSANNSAGDLTLQAGRSVEVSANITTDGGDITLIANDHLSNGVVDNERLTGDAVLTLADGTSLNAGAGAVLLELRSGSGKTYSANGDITLNNITAGTINIVQAGASSGHGTILRSAGRLIASATGNAINISSPYFINQSSSASALNPTHASGRYLLWTNDEDSNQLRSLSPEFIQYNAQYGSTTVQGSASDNGLLLRLAPTITAGLRSGPTKTYDGNTNASLSSADLTLNGVRTNDSVSATVGSGQFADANVGSNKQITASGIAIASASRGSTPIYGYQLASTSASGNLGTITAKDVTLSAPTANNKTYNQNTAASLSSSGTISGLIDGDSVSVSGGSASFADANVGSGKTVTFSGFSLSGDDASNYNLTTASTTTTADITAVSLSLSAPTASNKTYDQSAAATLSNQGSLSGILSGDDVSLTGGSASFADANVGSGKTVTFSGYSLTGDEAANYTLATSSTTTTADITAVSLSLSAPSANNKTYNQNTAATLSNQGSLSGILSGDDVSLTGGSASVADANVGSGKTVTFSGFSLSGDDARNYNLTTASTTTTADITAV
ncbi:MAG: YDG domain-containing protein, partial [Candidatus Puniceispirillaceae bacterium]